MFWWKYLWNSPKRMHSGSSGGHVRWPPSLQTWSDWIVAFSNWKWSGWASVPRPILIRQQDAACLAVQQVSNKKQQPVWLLDEKTTRSVFERCEVLLLIVLRYLLAILNKQLFQSSAKEKKKMANLSNGLPILSRPVLKRLAVVHHSSDEYCTQVYWISIRIHNIRTLSQPTADFQRPSSGAPDIEIWTSFDRSEME